MGTKIAKSRTRVLLAGLILCAAAGVLFGLARVVARHGPKVVDFIAAKMPHLEWPSKGARLLYAAWPSKMAFTQAFGLTAIGIFWAFLLSPLIIWIAAWNKGER